MGVNAGIILYPEGNPPTNLSTKSICIKVFEALQETGLLLPGNLSECLTEDTNPGIYWGQPSLQGTTISIEPKFVNPAIDSLVFTQTNDEFWDGNVPPGDKPQALALPGIRVFVIERSLPVPNSYNEEIICNTWAMIWFDMADCRLSDEIHTIRNEEHEVFNKLEAVFTSKVWWAVVPH
jgi:hypothetical protein